MEWKKLFGLGNNSKTEVPSDFLENLTGDDRTYVDAWLKIFEWVHKRAMYLTAKGVDTTFEHQEPEQFLVDFNRFGIARWAEEMNRRDKDYVAKKEVGEKADAEPDVITTLEKKLTWERIFELKSFIRAHGLRDVKEVKGRVVEDAK